MYMYSYLYMFVFLSLSNTTKACACACINCELMWLGLSICPNKAHHIKKTCLGMLLCAFQGVEAVHLWPCWRLDVTIKLMNKWLVDLEFNTPPTAFVI